VMVGILLNVRIVVVQEKGNNLYVISKCKANKTGRDGR